MATIGDWFYDYEYNGNGNPMGEPQKIDEINSLNTLNLGINHVWDAYIRLTLRYSLNFQLFRRQHA